MSGKPRIPATELRKMKTTFLELISKGVSILGVCQKIGINRQMYYRWKKRDSKFAKKMEQAQLFSDEIRCEIAESALMKGVNEGKVPLIKYAIDRYGTKKKKTTYEEMRIKRLSDKQLEIVQKVIERENEGYE